MPELPEVECNRLRLEELIINKTITSIEKLYPKCINEISLISLPQTIIKVDRIAKYLIIRLEKQSLVIHLGMTGKFLINQKFANHSIIKLNFKDNENLVFTDTRKFGHVWLIDDYQDLSNLKNLGADVFKDEFDIFYQRTVKHPGLLIKTILMDQKIIQGLGNIYANEVLFMTKIHPSTKVSSLTIEQLKNIYDCSKVIFEKSISLGGSTIHDYNSFGDPGSFQNELYVYNQTKCKVCEGDIEKYEIGGRSTYVCSKCQK